MLPFDDMHFVECRLYEGYSFAYVLKFKGNDKQTHYRTQVYVTKDFELKALFKLYLFGDFQMPRNVEKKENQEAFALLLPLLMKERLRISANGFPLKKMMEKYCEKT